MDLKIIIWIIGLLIYFYAQSKKARKPVEPSDEGGSQPARPVRPVTFEDLLREIQQSRQTEKPPARPEPEVVDYDDDIEEEAQPEERIPERTRYEKPQEEVMSIYEQAKQAAFNRASLEETASLGDTDVTFGKFKGYEQEVKPSLAAEIARDLKSPDSARKAVILAEVLNRRF